jgi:hypothetical protein
MLSVLLACAVAAAGPEQDLEFARRLAARGLDEMARDVLDKMATGDGESKKVAAYGKALLTKEEATRARNRFVRALEEGETPAVTRENVIALFDEARPAIEAYVSSRKEAVEAKFLLGELIQEYAEFLVGSGYPDDMAGEQQKLIDANKDKASQLFEAAIKNFKGVCDKLKKELGDEPDPTDPTYIRCTNAEFFVGMARFRWALIYPKGANFQYRIDEAIEELDVFLQAHYEELFGAYAMIYLGRAFMEKGLRTGDDNDVETAINYFQTLFETVPEDPAMPDTSNVIGEAFYWYCFACNAMASARGALKKEQPIFLDNTIRAGSLLPQKLKQGLKGAFALRAMLEVADAHALQQNFGDAVRISGEVLAAARVEGHRQVGKAATAKLKGWVASVAGAGALNAGLLFQIGESLAAQGRVGNAIAFYEKAVAAAKSDEDLEKFAYPARLKIALTYKKDKRLFAAAVMAMALVDDFLKSDADEDSAFGGTAAEACYQATLIWRQLADVTKRSSDKSASDKILDTFRDKFPAHPANSDQAYSRAHDVYASGDLEQAARDFEAINPTSKNYWRAQRKVPLCFRLLAQKETEEAKARQFHEKSRDAALKLRSLAEAKPNDPGAKKTLQYARLYTALAYHALDDWDDTLKRMGEYLKLYPDEFLKKGIELKVMIDAHLALGQLEKAEAALTLLSEKQPGSSYVDQANFDIYGALRTKFKSLESGPERVEVAGRAAKLWESILAKKTRVNDSDYFFLGDVLREAHRFQDAGEAFEAGAEQVGDEKKRSYFLLQAAEMQFKAAKDGLAKKEITRKEYLKILEKARQLFTDVLIPDKANQARILNKLAQFQSYPARKDFGMIKRRPAEILTAAEIYMESNPSGLDGRWITVRLIDHLHSFTKPTANPNNPGKLDEYVTLWWDGAELKLESLLAIAKTGSGQAKRAAKQKGQAFATKLEFQYKKMDGPQRVQHIRELKGKLGR